MFIALLNDQSDAYDVRSIRTYLDEAARPNGHQIFTSSIAFAEVTKAKLFKPGVGSFDEFVRDFEGQINIVAADPIVCQRAGALKDLAYKKGATTKRVLTTGDAIMLATALELQDTYGVTVNAFHTFDNGNGPRGPEGKGVPLLTYETWCEGIETNPLAKQVMELNRCKPIHPSPGLSL